MGDTYDSLVSYTGSRHSKDPEMQEICDRIDNLRCRDLAALAIAVSKERADQVSITETIKGSDFHKSSDVDQRVFHKIDTMLYDTFTDIPFVELSPVQPFGLNTSFAGLSESKILATTRKAEVNADISTALVREALLRDPDLLTQGVRLASSARITRAQKFDPDTKFLPHFKMFGQATVGRNQEGNNNSTNLSKHLLSEFDFLSQFQESDISSLENTTIEIGDVRVVDRLIRLGQVSYDEIKRNTTNPHYDLFQASNINIPKNLAPLDPELKTILSSLESDDIHADIMSLYGSLANHNPRAAEKCTIKLDRFAGHNYYLGTCYNLFGINADGLTLPLSDGGYTDWAQKATGNRNAFSISSGIGTELLARYFTQTAT